MLANTYILPICIVQMCCLYQMKLSKIPIHGIPSCETYTQAQHGTRKTRLTTSPFFKAALCVRNEKQPQLLAPPLRDPLHALVVVLTLWEPTRDAIWPVWPQISPGIHQRYRSSATTDVLKSLARDPGIMWQGPIVL